MAKRLGAFHTEGRGFSTKKLYHLPKVVPMQKNSEKKLDFAQGSW